MLNNVLGRVRLTLKAIMLDSMRQGRRSQGRRNAAQARTNLASIFGGFSTAVGNQRRSQLRRAAACESLETRLLLTPLALGQEVIDDVTYTTIAPTGAYNGTPMNLQLSWGGDLGSDFIADHYYGYDVNLGLGNGSVDLGTNPNIKVTGTPGNDIVRNNSGIGVGTALELTAYGHGGNDEFYGGQEYDKLIGGPGKDKLFGMGGDDVLYGGDATDNDELYGGTGEDRFYVANDGTNSGKDQVKDKRGHDSRIHFVDTIVSERGFSPTAWEDTEIELFDVVFNDFHDTTGNERLNQEAKVGGDLYFRRLGAKSGGGGTPAWSNTIDTTTYTEATFDKGDPVTKVTVAHEVLGHNYDSPTTNPFATAFQAISGWTQAVPTSSISFAEWTAVNPGWVKSDTSPFDGWYFNPGNNTKQTLFARDYGANSPFEDFATTVEAWYASEFTNNQPAWFTPLVATKQANLKLLFDKLTLPTTPSDLTIDQSFNINRPTFKWDSLVADSFRVQIIGASDNVVRDDTTLELTFPLTADLPAGTYTFLVSSMIDTEEESLTASINFTVNHAPQWTAGVQPPPMAGQNEDDRLAYGTTVLSLTAAASDVDAGAKKGIAIHNTGGLESGSWQYTLNGGLNWADFASLGASRNSSKAFLMPANGTLSRIRFVPNQNFNGTVQLGYYAWDQTQGSAGGNVDISTANKLGGLTAFSNGIHYTTLTVTPVNDAPVWVAGVQAPPMAVQNEDDRLAYGTTVASLTAAASDVDAGAKKGIAIHSTSGLESGSWQYTINGGLNWANFASLGASRNSSKAFLMPANGTLSRIRFVPNQNFNGTVQLGYYAWDQTQGTASGNVDLSTANKLGGTTAFGTGTHYASLTVSAVNDAPVWVAGVQPPPMAGQNEDDRLAYGTTVLSLTAAASDVDAGAKKGIAIHSTSGLESGSWQYTINGGLNWADFASLGASRNPSKAFLMPANGTLSRIRFVPNKDFNGKVQLGYYAWDQTQGTAGGNFDLSTANKFGGTTAFGANTHYASLTVSAVNDAPAWVTSTPPTLTPIVKDDFTSLGTTIASITAGVRDVDAGALKGIAVVGAPTGGGKWQFTLNGGNTWTNFPATSHSNARLLPANGTLSRVRFVPNPGITGNSLLQYFAWDQTQGTAGGTLDISTVNKRGGMTAFSDGYHFSTLLINRV